MPERIGGRDVLDLKKLRNDPDTIIHSLNRRGHDYSSAVNGLLRIDKKRRELMAKMESLRFEQNEANKRIAKLVKDKEDTTELFAKFRSISSLASDYKSQISDLEKEQEEILLSLPNTPHCDVPTGLSDRENKEVRRVDAPKINNFRNKPHWQIGADLDILDFSRASKITGSRFVVYKGLGAKLERAIISFFLDVHTKNGFKEILPPYIVNSKSMTGTGQLPKFSEDTFKLERSDYYLIPTAEVPVTNLHSGEILKESELPVKYCSYSACFRAEAGSAGKDTKGIIRQHQFNKVELVKFSLPENSNDELESLLEEAELILKILELPYRVVCLCTGDLGFSSAKTYDIEVWMPSYDRYVEISSCSNFLDFQSRRANIKYKNSRTGTNEFVHTLNGSGLAVGRTFAAILENYQNEDGSVSIPEALREYMGVNEISVDNSF